MKPFDEDGSLARAIETMWQVHLATPIESDDYFERLDAVLGHSPAEVASVPQPATIDAACDVYGPSFEPSEMDLDFDDEEFALHFNRSITVSIGADSFTVSTSGTVGDGLRTSYEIRS